MESGARSPGGGYQPSRGSSDVVCFAAMTADGWCINDKRARIVAW